MEFQVGDKIKINQETLDATKRQRVNGKHISGKWISGDLIRSGRAGTEFIVTSVDTYNLRIKKVLENGETQAVGWYSKSFFIHVNDILDLAEDF